MAHITAQWRITLERFGARAAVFLIIGSISVAPLQATSNLVNFQGRLIDPSTKNPKNGSFSLTFRLCDTLAASCASPLWTETQSATVTNGLFAVQLGAVTPLAAGMFTGSGPYLEIQVGAETLTPRELMAGAPYAFHASLADNIAPGSTNYVQAGSALQNGLTFHTSSGSVDGLFNAGNAVIASQLRLGNFAALPASNALGAGAVVFNSADNTIYVSNGSSWSPLASGQTSPWTAASGSVTLVSPANSVGIGTIPSEKLHVAGTIRSDFGVAAATGVFASGLTLGGSSVLTGLAAGTGILVTGSGASRTVAADVGTGAGQLVQLDGLGRLPAVDGSQLTAISTTQIANLGSLLAGKVSKASDTMTGDLQVGTVTASTLSASGYLTLANLGSAPAASRGRLYFDPTSPGALRISLDGSTFVSLATGTAAAGLASVSSNASQFSGDGTSGNPLTLLSSSATLQGNTFNGANQLVMLTGAGVLPVTVAASSVAAAVIGTSQLIDNAVTAAKIANATITDAQVASGANIAQSKIQNLASDLAGKVSKIGDTMTGDLQVGGASASTISASGYLTLANLGSAPGLSRGRLYFDSTGDGALKVSLDGSTFVPLATGTSSGLASVSANASQFSGNGTAGSPLTLLSSSVTLQGNTFNGANQLVKLTGGAALPALDGSALTNLPGGYRAVTLMSDGVGMAMVPIALGSEPIGQVSRRQVDLTSFTQARAQFSSSLLSASIQCRLEFSPDGGSTWNATALVPAFAAGTTADQNNTSAWGSIPAAAKADVQVRAVIIGNGILAPVIHYLELDYR